MRHPHRSLPHSATPATTYNARPRAGPVNGRMHHIGIGAEHARIPILKLALNTDRDYQALGRPPGHKPGKRRSPDPRSGSGLSGIS